MRKFLFFATILFCIGIILVSLFINDIPSFVEYQALELEKRADVLKSLIEGVAVIIAGLWTYELYIKNRYDHPYPKIQHRVQYYRLKEGRIYLSVFVTVTNEGKTKLDLGGGIIDIRQVSPMTENITNLIDEIIERSGDETIRNGNAPELFVDAGQRIGWTTLGRREWKQLRGTLRELEPGQTREIQFDFLLLDEDEIKIIEAISYSGYTKSSWEYVTLHTIH